MTKALYRYPAEWEKQEATWLAFPHNKLNWHGERGVKIRKFYVELIRTISEFQPVNVLIPNKNFLTIDEEFAVAESSCALAGRRLHEIDGLGGCLAELESSQHHAGCEEEKDEFQPSHYTRQSIWIKVSLHLRYS